MTTDAYKLKDEANKRKPVELYKFWSDSGNQAWYYTSGDVSVTYPATGASAQEYTPALMKRTRTQFMTDLKISKMTINVERLNPAFVTYLTQPMPEMIWVEVSKLFRDQSPLEKRVMFIGQVAQTGYDGQNGALECHGFEKFLKMKVPTMRYQPSCNLKLYSDQCGVALTTYGATVSGLDSISANGLELTDTAFGLQANDYFKLGYVKWGDFKRTIVGHTGDTITIQFYIPGLTAGQDIYVAPGCDKSMATCTNKYNNLGNTNLNRFFGFRYLPYDNPATWQA